MFKLIRWTNVLITQTKVNSHSHMTSATNGREVREAIKIASFFWTLSKSGLKQPPLPLLILDTREVIFVLANFGQAWSNFCKGPKLKYLPHSWAKVPQNFWNLVIPPHLPPFNVQTKVKLEKNKTTWKLLDSGWTHPLFWIGSKRKHFVLDCFPESSNFWSHLKRG